MTVPKSEPIFLDRIEPEDYYFRKNHRDYHEAEEVL